MIDVEIRNNIIEIKTKCVRIIIDKNGDVSVKKQLKE